MKNVKMIVAVDMKNGIGYQDSLPWPKNSADMEWFRNSTEGHVVLMGGATAKSLPKALRNRVNIVYTNRGENLPKEFGKIWGTPEDSIKLLDNTYGDTATIWIIGGAQTYEKFADFADELYITVFPSIFECDTYLSQDVIDKFPYKIEHQQYDQLDFMVLSKEDKLNVSTEETVRDDSE